MAKGARVLRTGDIVFPNKGRPPGPVQGFTRDKVNPFLFHPILDPCVHRGPPLVTKLCGGDKICWYCKLFKKEVSLMECYECPSQSS